MADTVHLHLQLAVALVQQVVLLALEDNRVGFGLALPISQLKPINHLHLLIQTAHGDSAAAGQVGPIKHRPRLLLLDWIVVRLG